MEVGHTEVRIVRWLLPLPEPLPLPDGWTHTEKVADRPDRHGGSDDVAVTLTVHQLEVPAGRTISVHTAVYMAAGHIPGLPVPAPESSPAAPLILSTTVTVVEAVTTAESPDAPEAVTSPADLLPRSDSLMRCLRLVTDIVRAYRATTGTPVALPTYEQLPSVLTYFSAPGMRYTDGARELTQSVAPWVGPSAILLDHLNSLDPEPGEEFSGATDSPFGQYIWALRTGDPRFNYRERFVEACRALNVNGEHGQAVVLAATASEVLIDWLLAMLLWEEQADAEASATLFQEGKTLRRLTQEIPDRLHGNWSTQASGPVANWHRQTYLQRHRVVHAGHIPGRAEAREALRATERLERHAMDRLVDRRTKYPRVTLMIVAEDGLRCRGLWSGKIKAFASSQALREENWRESFQRWYNALDQFRLARL